MPVNELDYEMMLTDPDWGKPTIGKDLMEKLNLILEETPEEKIIENLWELLSYYKTSLRLGFLDVWNGEYDYVVYYLSLAGDMLTTGNVKSFVTCLQRVADRLELSHSKKGAYRKLSRTSKHEYKEEVGEPPKKKPGWLGRRDTEE